MIVNNPTCIQHSRGLLWYITEGWLKTNVLLFLHEAVNCEIIISYIFFFEIYILITTESESGCNPLEAYDHHTRAELVQRLINNIDLGQTSLIVGYAWMFVYIH